MASTGKSELIILPLTLITSFSKYKLSCLMVFFISRLTLILGLCK